MSSTPTPPAARCWRRWISTWLSTAPATSPPPQARPTTRTLWPSARLRSLLLPSRAPGLHALRLACHLHPARVTQPAVCEDRHAKGAGWQRGEHGIGGASGAQPACCVRAPLILSAPHAPRAPTLQSGQGLSEPHQVLRWALRDTLVAAYRAGACAMALVARLMRACAALGSCTRGAAVAGEADRHPLTPVAMQACRQLVRLALVASAGRVA